VALVPDAIKRLLKSGAEVVVESDAGVAAHFADSLYVNAGATMVDSSQAVGADIVCSVRLPDARLLDAIRPGAVLIALMAGSDNDRAIDSLTVRGVTLLALERVPRITRAQSMDVLSSQATVAGYQAVLLGARALPRFLPMLTTAAGSIPPARALIIGAGVAGLQAIATARRLGAMVAAFDIRAAAAEQVLSLGAQFVATDAIAAESETAGGYAREMGDEQQQRVLAAIGGAIIQSDLVISTAAIPGKPAPRLITEAMVATMKPGSVIIDASAETGGNCELTRPGETVVYGEVTIMGPLNLAADMPQHASQMFARNVQALLDHLAPEGSLSISLNDEITGAMCIAHDGNRRNGGST
jgi:NAD(P) transhydrogenase subunit alpha